MKNIVSWVCLLALLVCGCGKDEMSRHETVSSIGRVFTTSFEQDGSRTYLADDRSSRWTAKDLISLFDGSTLNLKYEFQGETGATSGDFYMISKPEGTGSTLATNYAVYPYSDNITITDNGTITTTLPAIQPYAQNSFGLGANTMVAVTQDADDTFLTFKNVCGCLMLQFYGENVTVKSVTLTGNQEEKIAGKATLTAAFKEAPSVSMADEATTSITLDCGTEGVQLSASAQEATAFWMAVPPTTFANGFTITVTDMNNKVFTLTTDMEIAITRNKVKPIAAVEVNLEDSQALACNLPAGEAFRDAIIEHAEDLGFSSPEEKYIRGIKFIAQSTPQDKSFSIDCVGEDAYLEKVDDSLYIHTAAQEFVFNEDCSYMFGASSSETRIFEQVKKIDFNECINTSKVTDMHGMFSFCSSLTSLDLCNFDTRKVTNINAMFAQCSSLTSLDLRNFDTSNVTNMGAMFVYCSSLISLDLSNFDTGNAIDMKRMFESCSSLTKVDLHSFNTSNVTDMNAMFMGCRVLTQIDLSNFNTEKVTNMSGMFRSCSSLTSLVLSTNFKTRNVTEMIYMFLDCSSLKSLDLNSFDTSNVTDMSAMFMGCELLSEFDVSNFKTEKVMNMTHMFYNCSSITALDLSNFDTSNVIDMSNMFGDCINLTSLDLSNFNTSKVTNMVNLFYHVGANIQENDKTQIKVPSPNPFEGKDETTKRDPNKTEFIVQSSN